MPIIQQLGARDAPSRCWADEVGWEQLPEQDGVENFHHAAPGSREPGLHPACPWNGNISPFSFFPTSSDPHGATSLACWDTWTLSTVSLGSHGLVLLGAVGMLEFGCPCSDLKDSWMPKG